MVLIIGIDGSTMVISCAPCREAGRTRLWSIDVTSRSDIVGGVRGAFDHAHLEHGDAVDFSRPGGGQDTDRKSVV